MIAYIYRHINENAAYKDLSKNQDMGNKSITLRQNN